MITDPQFAKGVEGFGFHSVIIRYTADFPDRILIYFRRRFSGTFRNLIDQGPGEIIRRKGSVLRSLFYIDLYGLSVQIVEQVPWIVAGGKRYKIFTTRKPDKIL